MTFEEKLDKAYESFNGYQENLLDILIDMLEEDDLEDFGDWLDSESSISEEKNYEYYNQAFEKVYGHPAFDEDGNSYK
jgi:hypothetical protein